MGSFCCCFSHESEIHRREGAGQFLQLGDPVPLNYHASVGPPPEDQLCPLGKPLGLGVAAPGVQERLGWSQALVWVTICSWKWWAVPSTHFLSSLRSACLGAAPGPVSPPPLSGAGTARAVSRSGTFPPATWNLLPLAGAPWRPGIPSNF